MTRYIVSVTACLLLFSPSAFAWTVNAGFEGGVVGTKAQSPNPDAFHDAAGDSRYVDSPVLTGSQAGSVSIGQGQTAFGTWGGGFNFPSDLGEGDSIWFRVNAYYPEGWDFSTPGAVEGMKFMRIHSAAANGNNEGYHSTLISGGATGGLINASTEVEGTAFFTNNGPYPYTKARRLGTDIARDQWGTYEMQIALSSVPGEGAYRIWQDGNLIFEDLATATLRSSTSVVDFIYLYTYWNSGAPRTQTSYLDDIVITSDTPNKFDAFGNPMIGVPVPEPTSAALGFLAAISHLARRYRPCRFR
jgi:hypothetical protein